MYRSCTVLKVKGKSKGQDTWYSATHTEWNRDQQRFTILEVATVRHERVILKYAGTMAPILLVVGGAKAGRKMASCQWCHV